MPKQYTAVYASSKPKKNAPITTIRATDKTEISVGDVVMLRDDPEVEGNEFALIQSFKHGDQGLECKCILMKQYNDAEALTPKHLIPDAKKNRFSKGQELILLNSIVDVLVEELQFTVECVSVDAFDALPRDGKKEEDLYFCRYVFDNDANKTSMEFDWSDITKDMPNFVDTLYELITDKPRRRRAAVKASRQTSKHIDSDEEDHSDYDKEEVEEEDDVDDDYDIPEEKPKTPKKPKTKKTPATTPRKRALEDHDLPQPDNNATPMSTPKKKRKTENGLATPKR